MASLTKHYLISGRVQGVGYRAFARRQAIAAVLRGWARNLNDGRVEIVASGPAEALTRFESSLRQGPPNGRVESVEVRAVDGGDLPAEFELRKDGVEPWT